MFSPTLRTAVLHATALYTISMVLFYNLSRSMFAEVFENEGYKNYSQAINGSAMRFVKGNGTRSRLLLQPTNTTLVLPADKPFYLVVLPQEVAVFFLLAPLQYWWYMALERILPARSRDRSSTADLTEKEGSEDREEEVVKKWIAQGRVRRASLNWCNTFLKWVLEMSVGRLVYHTLEHFMRELLRLTSPKSLLVDLKRVRSILPCRLTPFDKNQHLAYNAISTVLSTDPFATLMSFIFVPAHKRIVFLAGADLAMSIFLNTVVRAFAAWVVKTETAQITLRDLTEALLAGKGGEGEVAAGSQGHDGL
jgi:hypothetical protein